MTTYDYRGAIHCHTTYSDGTGSVDEVMKAANEVGLDFVMMTDHDTMKPHDDGHDKWWGSSLLICGTEITPQPNVGNHYIVFGEERLNVEGLNLKQPQEIIDEVSRQGWFGFIAHPDHQGTKRFNVPSYAWKEWNARGYAGLGLWDLQTDWQAQLDRDDANIKVYTEFETALAGPRNETIQRWDELCRQGKVVGIGEIDNHNWTREFEGQTLQIFPYETAFRTISNHVLIDKPLDKNYGKARRQILEAVRHGRMYISFDFWDDPTEFSFEVDNGTNVGRMGDEVALGERTELVVTLPDEALLNVFHNGESIHEEENDEVLLEISQPGVYRVEAMRDNLTWILSNPIWVGKPV